MNSVSNGTQQKSTTLERYKLKRNKKGSTETRKAVDLSDNAIYDILVDATIPYEDRMNKIVEMLTLNVDSEAAVQESQQNVQMVKDIVKELLDQFTSHNRKSIEFTRDNPLSQLKESIQEVFDNYHSLSVGRSALKNKLTTVDSLIEEVGGEDKLVIALVEAKSRKAARDAKYAEVEEAKAEQHEVSFEVKKLSINYEDLVVAEAEASNKFLASVRPGVQSEIADIKKKKEQVQNSIAEAKARLEAADETLDAKIEELNAYTQSNDYRVHEKISRILDIASPEFKDQLTRLAEATLTYIDDTQNVMSQVRDQLEHLLKDVDVGLDVNVNIREQVAILSGAMQRASDASSKKLSDFKKESKSDDVSALAKLENDKIARAGDIFVSETSSTLSSVTLISSEVQKIEVVLLSLRDQLADGLSDADEQLLMAVNTASASGMVMLNRAQTLGTLAQAVISRGQYMNEAEETFGQLTQEFERSLAVKAGRNDIIASLSSVISDISSAMDERNDAATAIAMDRRELITDLNEKIDRLRQSAEDTRELESRVNEQLAASAN